MPAASFELLETLRWTPDEGWYLLGRHLDRMEASARHFGYRCSRDQIERELARAVTGAAGPLRVRLLVGADGASRIEQTPLVVERRPVRVRLALDAIDPADVFLYHKTTHRAVYERARRPDCDDVILWNPLGEATESTIANLVVEMKGRRVTPPSDCGLLPGTLRAELLATGEIGEERVPLSTLKTAARVWLINSVRGWTEATVVPDTGR